MAVFGGEGGGEVAAVKFVVPCLQLAYAAHVLDGKE